MQAAVKGAVKASQASYSELNARTDRKSKIDNLLSSLQQKRNVMVRAGHVT